MTARGNALGVWMHRAFKGRLDGGGGGREGGVLMLTSPGRRTGLPRSTMVRFLADGDDYLVWGTGGGSPAEPDWFRNLRRAEEATVEIGTTSRRVRPEVLEGSTREAVWLGTIRARIPGVQRYERRSGRTIPVARLHPVAPTADGATTTVGRD